MQTRSIALFMGVALSTLAPAVRAGGFGSNGVVIHPTFTTYTNSIMSSVMQPDGKIVSGGSLITGNTREVALARYLPDGTPDSTFGTQGLVRGTLLSPTDEGNAIALQPDGKLVVGGRTDGGTTYIDMLLARFHANGSRDYSFGFNGVTRLSVGRGWDEIHAAAVAADGKILAAGSTQGSTGAAYPHYFVARFHPNGAPDSTFGTGGVVLTTIGTHSTANALILQPDGKILTGGYCWNGTKYEFALTRHHATGALDTSFGSAGIFRRTTSMGSLLTRKFALARQTDGKILLGGPSLDGSYAKFTVLRVTASGLVDNSFGYSGRATASLGYYEAYPFSLAIQPDGKIVQAGWSRDATRTWNNVGLVRFLPGGTLDSTFGSYGTVITDVTPSTDAANALGLQTDGKIVATGVAGSKLLVARYRTNGALDVP